MAANDAPQPVKLSLPLVSLSGHFTGSTSDAHTHCVLSRNTNSLSSKNSAQRMSS